MILLSQFENIGEEQSSWLYNWATINQTDSEPGVRPETNFAKKVIGVFQSEARLEPQAQRSEVKSDTPRRHTKCWKYNTIKTTQQYEIKSLLSQCNDVMPLMLHQG